MGTRSKASHPSWWSWLCRMAVPKPVPSSRRWKNWSSSSALPMQAGCDVLDIDLPSPDTYLEGEYIVRRMKRADGVFVGSAILKLQNDPAKLQEAIRCFKQMCL